MTYPEDEAKRPFINPDFKYAVVGATTNQAKYGYRVLMDLKYAGFDVVGVNPKYKEIEGVPIYPTLADIPDKPDMAVFVIPAAAGVKVLDQAKELGIARVWFQPGAEDDAVKKRIRDLELDGSADGACIMIVRKALANR